VNRDRPGDVGRAPRSSAAAGGRAGLSTCRRYRPAASAAPAQGPIRTPPPEARALKHDVSWPPSTRIAATTSWQTRPRATRSSAARWARDDPLPFGCPDGCVFYEPRRVSSAGCRSRPKTRSAEPGGASAPSRPQLSSTSPSRSTPIPSVRSHAAAASMWAGVAHQLAE